MPKSFANCEIFTWLLRGSIGKSLTYIKKSSGLRTEPCGVPAFNRTLSEASSFIFTDIVQLVINEDISLTIFLGRSPVISLCLKPLCHTESNAFSTSMNTAAPTLFASWAIKVSSVSLSICSIAHRLFLYPNCQILKNDFSSSSPLILFASIFSNNLPMQLNKLMGL